MAPAIEVKNLTTGYRGHTALEDVSFSMPPGKFLGLLGPNGSGKSTLIKTLIGLLDPWEGDVRVLGETPRSVRRRVGYMPQAEDIDWAFPATVQEVVAMGLYRRAFGLSRFRRGSDEQDRIMAALKRLSVDHLANRQAGELSGGQQRRVLCARALVKDPDLFLLDEPTAGLDARSEEEMLDLLSELAADGASIVLCTHDIGCAYDRCDLTLFLNRNVMTYGPPAVTITEEMLNRTFEGHVLVMGSGGSRLALAPHDHHEHGDTHEHSHHSHALHGHDEHGRV
jgi:ABC-type Mn2+/Zn2+ transport system ATPase subunit